MRHLRLIMTSPQAPNAPNRLQPQTGLTGLVQGADSPLISMWIISRQAPSQTASPVAACQNSLIAWEPLETIQPTSRIWKIRGPHRKQSRNGAAKEASLGTNYSTDRAPVPGLRLRSCTAHKTPESMEFARPVSFTDCVTVSPKTPAIRTAPYPHASRVHGPGRRRPKSAAGRLIPPALCVHAEP